MLQSNAIILPSRHTIYDSKNIAKVRQFALGDSIEILVMTIDSLNKDDNVIKQSMDRLQGATCNRLGLC